MSIRGKALFRIILLWAVVLIGVLIWWSMLTSTNYNEGHYEPPLVLNQFNGQPSVVFYDEVNDIVHLEGPITFEMAEEVYNIVVEGNEVKWFTLNSKGGYLSAALVIGTIIKTYSKYQFAVVAVPLDSVCYSACAMIWLAGDSKVISPGSRIAFHRPYIPDGMPADDVTKMLSIQQAYNDLYKYVVGTVGLNSIVADDILNTPSSTLLPMTPQLSNRWNLQNVRQIPLSVADIAIDKNVR